MGKSQSGTGCKLELFFSGKAPKVDWSAIEQKAGSATRAASATVLGALATQVENMIVASADLSNSDKTDGFLKKLILSRKVISAEHSSRLVYPSCQWLVSVSVCLSTVVLSLLAVHSSYSPTI